MSSPYRDAPPAEEAEPIPDLAVDRRLSRGLLVCSAVSIAIAAVLFIGGWATESVELLALSAPGLLLLATIAILERPAGAWLARRHARTVAEGVARLEAKAAPRKQPS